MREHKVKAWDGEKMLGPVNIEDMMFADGFYFDHMPWRGKKDDRHTKAIIVEFTGLTDKNGVEIYEGDICYYHNPRIKALICEIRNIYGCAYVIERKWIDEDPIELMSDPIHTWQSDCINDGKADSFEVIGNIYENRNLLCE